VRKQESASGPAPSLPNLKLLFAEASLPHRGTLTLCDLHHPVVFALRQQKVEQGAHQGGPAALPFGLRGGREGGRVARIESGRTTASGNWEQP